MHTSHQASLPCQCAQDTRAAHSACPGALSATTTSGARTPFPGPRGSPCPTELPRTLSADLWQIFLPQAVTLGLRLFCASIRVRRQESFLCSEREVIPCLS